MATGSTHDPKGCAYMPLDGEGFSDQKIRNSFVIKVLSLLTSMLLMTTTVVAVVTVSSNTQTFLLDNWWISSVAMVTLLCVSIALACSMQLRQSFPVNYILLSVMTFSQAMLLSYIVSAFQTPSVLISVAITCLGTATVAVLAMSSHWDLTHFGIHLIVALLTLVLVELLLFAFTPSLRGVDRLVGGVAALLFSIYIAVDIQLLLGGQHFLLYHEDYIGAVITLHLDLVNVGTTLYKLIGEYKDRRPS
ncbi:hypothetical protein BIW11_06072 [Tropilaelaps mercedesae]|uniref:Protein TAG-120-like n=1 Tax=Tropilaelaps mercedesae TaxID=418985 RepID=A0A1V9XZP8_9ACAR|nr:Protein TAG-120-like [Tropilaelaps mercedesae]OQR78945.1 hypothetical protein BIW11_06072 [Tropilaelaps mercedesae]